MREFANKAGIPAGKVKRDELGLEATWNRFMFTKTGKAGDLMSPAKTVMKKGPRSGSTKPAKKRNNSRKTDNAPDHWLEIGVECNPAAGEPVSERIGPYGEGGAVIESRPEGPSRFSDHPVSSSVWVKIYLPAALWKRKRAGIEGLLSDLRKEFSISDVRTRELGPKDWTEQWKKGYEIRKISRRLVIVPSWKDYLPKPGEVVVTMDPGMAFGTGLHPTTRLCLIALEKYLKTGQRVLDVGTGSGILAITAVKFGAGSVDAIDIESVAIEVAGRNAVQNGVANRVTLQTGMLKDLGTKISPADLVLVNILAYTIIKMLPELKANLKPGGHIITSGILNEYAPDVEAAMKKEGLEIVEVLQEDDWVSLVAHVAAL
jgi:ribosomal protein L11 methyltransferase